MSERVNYGRLKDVIDIPDLIELQTKSYADFLQLDKHPDERENQGLQEIFKDIFPDRENSTSETGCGLEFVRYEIGEPKVPLVDCL